MANGLRLSASAERVAAYQFSYTLDLEAAVRGYEYVWPDRSIVNGRRRDRPEAKPTLPRRQAIGDWFRLAIILPQCIYQTFREFLQVQESTSCTASLRPTMVCRNLL